MRLWCALRIIGLPALTPNDHKDYSFMRYIHTIRKFFRFMQAFWNDISPLNVYLSIEIAYDSDGMIWHFPILFL